MQGCAAVDVMDGWGPGRAWEQAQTEDGDHHILAWTIWGVGATKMAWAAHLAGQGNQPLDVIFTGFGFVFSGWCCGKKPHGSQQSSGSLAQQGGLAGHPGHPGGWGGYLLGTDVEPRSHAYLSLSGSGWCIRLPLIHCFVPLPDFGTRWLPLWDRSSSGEHVPTARSVPHCVCVQATKREG